MKELLLGVVGYLIGGGAGAAVGVGVGVALSAAEKPVSVDSDWSAWWKGEQSSPVIPSLPIARRIPRGAPLMSIPPPKMRTAHTQLGWYNAAVDERRPSISETPVHTPQPINVEPEMWGGQIFDSLPRVTILDQKEHK